MMFWTHGMELFAQLYVINQLAPLIFKCSDHESKKKKKKNIMAINLVKSVVLIDVNL